MFSWFYNTSMPNSIRYLHLLSKRVNAMADANAIPDESHKLWITWSNMKLMLNKADGDYYREVMYFSAVMSMKIDDYAVNNMLNGDSTVARILYELDSIKPCAYELLEVIDVTSGQ